MMSQSKPCAVILHHHHHRPLIDAEVIRRDPPAGRAALHRERLIERRLEPVFVFVMPRSISAKWRTVGTTISGANGREATTTHGATVLSSGPNGAPQAT